MRLLLLILMITSFGLTAVSQSDSYWSVLILKKGYSPLNKEDMSSYAANGFYLY